MSASSTNTASATSNLVAIASPEMFTSLMQQDLNRVTLLNFWASWAQPCEPMTKAITELAPKYPHVLFMNVEAEEQPDVSESFDVDAVPTIVMLRGHTLLAKLTGGNVLAVEQALASHASTASAANTRGLAQSTAAPQAAPSTYTAAAGGAAAPASQVDETFADPAKPHALPPTVHTDNESKEETERRCRELMSRSKVMLFMKGQPSMPRCGFSQKIVSLLREQNVDFDYYDILSDENVRQTLKVLNDWPTFPQVIVNGELVGGLDIVKEMIASGELQEVLQASS